MTTTIRSHCSAGTVALPPDPPQSIQLVSGRRIPIPPIARLSGDVFQRILSYIAPDQPHRVLNRENVEPVEMPTEEQFWQNLFDDEPDAPVALLNDRENIEPLGTPTDEQYYDRTDTAFRLTEALDCFHPAYNDDAIKQSAKSVELFGALTNEQYCEGRDTLLKLAEALDCFQPDKKRITSEPKEIKNQLREIRAMVVRSVLANIWGESGESLMHRVDNYVCHRETSSHSGLQPNNLSHPTVAKILKKLMGVTRLSVHYAGPTLQKTFNTMLPPFLTVIRNIFKKQTITLTPIVRNSEYLSTSVSLERGDQRNLMLIFMNNAHSRTMHMLTESATRATGLPYLCTTLDTMLSISALIGRNIDHITTVFKEKKLPLLNCTPERLFFASLIVSICFVSVHAYATFVWNRIEGHIMNCRKTPLHFLEYFNRCPSDCQFITQVFGDVCVSRFLTHMSLDFSLSELCANQMPWTVTWLIFINHWRNGAIGALYYSAFACCAHSILLFSDSIIRETQHMRDKSQNLRNVIEDRGYTWGCRLINEGPEIPLVDHLPPEMQDGYEDDRP